MRRIFAEFRKDYLRSVGLVCVVTDDDDSYSNSLASLLTSKLLVWSREYHSLYIEIFRSKIMYTVSKRI